jgi:hypothetical protein
LDVRNCRIVLFAFGAVYTYEENNCIFIIWKCHYLIVYSKTTFKDVLMVDVATCTANGVKFVILNLSCWVKKNAMDLIHTMEKHSLL